MGKVIGIDLGTTNSCVAIMDGKNAKVIENSEGARTTPSIVAFADGGERLVGQPAKRQAVTNPENTIFAVKRLIGRRFEDPMVGKDKDLVPYTIVKGDNGDAWVNADGKKYSPSQISAMTLAKMKGNGRGLSRHERDAGRHHRPRLFSMTPSARPPRTPARSPALRCCASSTSRRPPPSPMVSTSPTIPGPSPSTTSAAGTFDISVLEIGDGVFEVKSTNGDTFLGGEDFDMRLVNYLADEFKKEQGIDLRGDKLALQRLKEAAEKAKIELSSSAQTEINLPFITADAKGAPST